MNGEVLSPVKQSHKRVFKQTNVWIFATISNALAIEIQPRGSMKICMQSSVSCIKIIKALCNYAVTCILSFYKTHITLILVNRAETWNMTGMATGNEAVQVEINSLTSWFPCINMGKIAMKQYCLQIVINNWIVNLLCLKWK